MDARTERVAVVGGGIAGLACARRLVDEGWEVEVFDKARKAGGRMSTRRTDDLTFDHGTPYFTARDASFRKQVQAWVDAGVAAPWVGTVGNFVEGETELVEQRSSELRYVGVPTMSAIPRAMSEGLVIQAPVRITEVSRVPTGFILGDTDGSARRPYAWVVVATPAQQAVNLLAANRQLNAAAERSAMQPCLTAMVAFEEPLPVNFAAAFVEHGPLDWVGRQNTKPERPPHDAWVLHASPEWSQAHLSEKPDTFAPKLLRAFAKLLGGDLPATTHLAGHRWRYAKTGQPVPNGFLLDAKLGLAACGDWCMGPGVEEAWRSGHSLAEHMLEAAVAR